MDCKLKTAAAVVLAVMLAALPASGQSSATDIARDVQSLLAKQQKDQDTLVRILKQQRDAAQERGDNLEADLKALLAQREKDNLIANQARELDWSSYFQRYVGGREEQWQQYVKPLLETKP